MGGGNHPVIVGAVAFQSRLKIGTMNKHVSIIETQIKKSRPGLRNKLRKKSYLLLTDGIFYTILITIKFVIRLRSYFGGFS